MKLFNDIIKDIRNYIKILEDRGAVREKDSSTTILWPVAEKGGIVLKDDTGVELGNPDDESVSFVVWTEDRELVRDGAVTLIGSDLQEASGKSLPFGKVVILSVNGFNEDNCYERHRDIDLMRYDLNLEGYMMRAVSQYMREWSRVSKSAVEGGASLISLGRTLIEMYMEKDFIDAAEVLFVTRSSEDVLSLAEIGGRAQQLINAMNKMVEEMSFDCDTCDYFDVCSEIEDLRAIRDNLAKKN